MKHIPTYFFQQKSFFNLKLNFSKQLSNRNLSLILQIKSKCGLQYKAKIDFSLLFNLKSKSKVTCPNTSRIFTCLFLKHSDDTVNIDIHYSFQQLTENWSRSAKEK